MFTLIFTFLGAWTGLHYISTQPTVMGVGLPPSVMAVFWGIGLGFLTGLNVDVMMNMKSHRLIIIALTFQILTNLSSMAYADFKVDGNNPVPKGAKVSLELDKDGYFLGEPVLLHFCLKNTGEGPFSFTFGGDYRGSTRSLRFKVKVTDENGKVMPDPDVFQDTFGGIGGTLDLKPHEEWCESLPLSRYVYLEKPGTYSIEAYHDFGWKETAGNAFPKGKTTIKMKLPDENQVKKFFQNMYELPERNNVSEFGKKSPVYADFTALGFPLYIPLLLEKAKQNDENALEALVSMPTPEATRALIELLNNNDPEFVIKVYQWGLNRRIPDPKTQEYLQGEYAHEPYYHKLKNWTDQVWRDEFAGDALKYGRKFLTSANIEIQSIGGTIIARLGTAEDIPSVITSLTDIIEKTKKEPQGYPFGVKAPDRIYGVVQDLIKKNAYQPSTDPHTSGEIAAYLAALTVDNNFRPKGWKEKLEKWLSYNIEFIRKLALNALNSDVVNEERGDVIKSLYDPQLSVRMAACEAVDKFNVKVKGEIVRSFVDSDNIFALNCWVDVAKKQGMRWEMLNVLDDQLKEGNDYCGMMSAIDNLLIDGKMSDSSCNGNLRPGELDNVKKKLKDFLMAHKDRLKANQGFPNKVFILP